jgi:hypothetical protein
MKNLISLFLAIVIAIGVAVPLMVQLHGEDVYEMKEKSGDGDDEEDYKIGKEKDIYAFSIQVLTKFDAFSTENSREKQYYKHEGTVSENHAFRFQISRCNKLIVNDLQSEMRILLEVNS